MKHYLLGVLLSAAILLPAGEADLILHNGHVITVDGAFSIHSAVAVGGQRILRCGTDADVLTLKGARTQIVDLDGKTVLPGLIDSHTHPIGASMTEFDHPIPEMETIQDVLDYIASRTKVLAPGEWIVLQQVFITRLKEQRYPTRAEMDRVAPEHPVVYRTGPDAALNSLALKLSGLDRDFKVNDGGPGFLEKDATGEINGVLRNCTRFVKMKSSGRTPTNEDRRQRLLALLKDYSAAGITSICDRDGSQAGLDLFKALRSSGELPVRVSISMGVPYIGGLDALQERIRSIAADDLFKEKNDWLRIIGVKTYLDGGMLTGSAYMREPWGVSAMYAITDPAYRGVLFIPKERLAAMVKTAAECGLQFTAHSVGDGAVHQLLEVYEELGKQMALKPLRPCLTHANFQSREAVEQAARVGAVMDIQPVWLFLDTRTLVKQFGVERLRYFQPLKSLFAAGVPIGGGSDHMQKIGALRSINAYSPFLGIATAVTRRAKWHDGSLHPDEALTREQAIRMFTANNAYLLFAENQRGSLEAGKLADLIVIDRDVLTCPEDQIVNTKVLRTYVGGKLVFEAR